MTLQGHLVTSLELRSTFLESMVRKSGNVKSVLRSMLFNLIGKLILRLVVLRSIDVIVALSSPGNNNNIFLKNVKNLINTPFDHFYKRDNNLFNEI
jgi:hypothetical protein